MRRRTGGDCAGPARALRCGASGIRAVVSQADADQSTREKRHFFIHGRRAEPSRVVRQQTPTCQIRWYIAAGRTVKGLPSRFHQSELEATRAEIQVCRVRSMWRRTFRAVAALV